MEGSAFPHRRTALIGFALALVAALLVPAESPSATKDPTPWHYMYDRHFRDSNGFGIKDSDGERVGTGRIVDIFISPSAERFRNRPGGVMKRVYRVLGAFHYQVDDDFGMQVAVCGQKVPRGSYALKSPKGKRLFFPRERSSLRQQQALGSVGINIKGVEVSLPFPAFDFYTYADTRPTVVWGTPTSRKHGWGWTSPVDPSGENFEFAGHWAAAARGTKVKIKCGIGTNDNLNVADGSIKIGRFINP